MARVSGHALWHEGAAYNERGQRIEYGDRTVGRAKCECGEMSPVCDSGAQRRRWHGVHKDRVLFERLSDGAADRRMDEEGTS